MITAFVLIASEPNSIAELAPAVAEVDGVREAHSVAGSKTDLVAVVTVPTHEDVATVVTERIARLVGVQSTETMIAFRSYTSEELDAGFDGFGD